MPTILKTKNSVTTTVVPTTLVQGELAVNITDKKMWVGNAATTPVQLLGAGADSTFTNISVSGVATFGAGTVSAPSITTTGDTNTGIFFPAADTIAFTEGGVESMRIDSAGTVGVGVTPSAWGSGYKAIQIGGGISYFTGGSSNYTTANAFRDSVGDYKRITSDFATMYQQTSGVHTWSTAASSSAGTTISFSESMRIDGSGNCGIGTTAPTSTAGFIPRLQLTSAASTALVVTSTASTQQNLIGTNGSGLFIESVGNATGTDNNIIFRNTSTNSNYGGIERMRITSAGNVGIGITNPSQKLIVIGNIANEGRLIPFTSSTGTVNLLEFSQGGTRGAGNNWGMFWSDSAGETNAALWASYTGGNNAAALVFGTNAGTGGSGGIASTTERMRISSAGLVGIGTNNPQRLLDVHGAAGAGGGEIGIRLVDTSNSNFGIQLIRTGPTFSYNGIGALEGVLYSSNTLTLASDSNTNMKFATGGSERMRIDSSGRILAGTTTGGANALLACNSGSNYWQYGASTTGSSIFWVLTSGGTGVSLTAGNTSWAAQSDERTKDIIEPIGDALNKVSTLRAVIGKYKTDEEGTRRSFLIAQDVKAVLPEVIDTDTDEQGTMSIRYTEVIPLLVASIKELKAIVDQQSTELDSVKAELQILNGN